MTLAAQGTEMLTPVAGTACSGPSPPRRRSALSGTACTTIACWELPSRGMSPSPGIFSQKQPPALGTNVMLAASPDQV